MSNTVIACVYNYNRMPICMRIRNIIIFFVHIYDNWASFYNSFLILLSGK
jgi:hypothetical protein